MEKGFEVLLDCVEDLFGWMAEVDCQFDFSDDRVGRVGARFEEAYSSETRYLFRLLFDFEDEFGGGNEGVASILHGSASGVAFFAMDGDAVPSHALDASDDSDSFGGLFESFGLLDV